MGADRRTGRVRRRERRTQPRGGRQRYSDHMSVPRHPHRARVVLGPLCTVIAGVIVLALPGSATARLVPIPPGNSGVNQYVESVPTASGGRPTSTVHPVAPPPGSERGGPMTDGAGTAGAIPVSTQHSLVRNGSDGRAADALARATTPAPGPASARLASGQGSPSGRANDAGPSPATGIADALTGSSSSGGLGYVLPVVLIISALGAVWLAVRRHRRMT